MATSSPIFFRYLKQSAMGLFRRLHSHKNLVNRDDFNAGAEKTVFAKVPTPFTCENPKVSNVINPDETAVAIPGTPLAIMLRRLPPDRHPAHVYIAHLGWQRYI